ncbi:hypothetical protein AA14337_3202 [Acetobacter malorum DSM 14337]|uniref:STAS domain-containing protein n=1 Tax=Acetobacter malorum DSM 14337 TaxID=1307910 RepID=A0ABQ0Q082_9PROT|nr:hypothetical protein [Acetobacter malorum]GBQ85943.1 hypothetical protein AA14337_3202 [Acetobacter malorum DSM 14337]
MSGKPSIPEFERLPLDLGSEDGPEQVRLRSRISDLSGCRVIIDKGSVRPSGEQLAKTVNDVLDDLEFRFSTAVRFPSPTMAAFALSLLKSEQMLVQAHSRMSESTQGKMDELLHDSEMSILFITQIFSAKSQHLIYTGQKPPSDEIVDPIDMETLSDVLKFVSEGVEFVRAHEDELPFSLAESFGASKDLIFEAIEALRPANPQMPSIDGKRAVH